MKFFTELFENRYVRGAGAILIGWLLVWRFDASEYQRGYWIGQSVGAGFAALVLGALAALAIQRLRPWVVVIAMFVVGISAPIIATAQTGKFPAFSKRSTAAAGPTYLPNSYVTDWMSRDRVICYDRDASRNNCLGVTQVVAVNARAVDLMFLVYTPGAKVAWPQRLDVRSNGLCYRVPDPDAFNFIVYRSSTAIAEISKGDEAVVLTRDQRAEFWRMGMGASGWQAGDEICARYTVHDRQGDSVRALEEHIWKNGVPSPDDSGSVLHFYNEGTRLALRDVATAE